eukprot:CCRYP_019006-RA/>CCRYP_019006-RA protein AED:0.06 eAED:0.06 QI:52/1/1/1/0.5/0.33/3/477/473
MPQAKMSTNVLPSLVHAIGGSIGSALAILAFYPLERIRVELQSHSCGHVVTAVDEDTSRDGVGDADGNGQHVNDSDNDEDDMDADGHESFEIVKYTDISDLEIINKTPSGHVGAQYSTSQSPVKIDGDRDILTTVNFEDNASTIKSKTEPSVKVAKQSSHNVNKVPSSESMLQCLLRLQNEKSLYKGASHMTITLMISNFIFFYALQLTKRSLTFIHPHEQRQQHQRPGDNHIDKRKLQILHRMLRNYLYPLLPQSKMATSLLSSSIAGIINVLLTNPLWVASLRIMESKVPVIHSTRDGDDPPNKDATLWTVIHDIAHSEGVSQLWSGTWTSLLLVSNPIIQHFMYEQMRSWLLGRKHGRLMKSRAVGGSGRQQHGKGGNILLQLLTLTPLEAFIFGALAKTVATVTTYPLQLAQVLLRLQTKRVFRSSNDEADTNNSATKEPTYAGTMDCLCQQFARGGIPALFHDISFGW